MENDTNPFEVKAHAPEPPKSVNAQAQQPDTDNKGNISHPERDLEFLDKVPDKYVNKQFFMGSIFFVFLIGIFFGFLFFGGDEAPVNTGLAGVVGNPEVPSGRPRCGMVEYGQGCVLYIVNSNRREINAKELYSLAAQITKVPVYMIETGNLRYNNTLIKPGYIAQINIQPTR